MIEKACKDLKGRCRWFDIIHVSGRSVPLQFKNNRLHSVQEKENSGFGVRANVDCRTGFSYTNTDAGLSAAARRALELAHYGDEERFDLPERCAGGSGPYDASIEEFDIDREISSGEECIEAILTRFPDAVVDLSISKSTGFMRLKNSHGVDVSYRSSAYSAGISLNYVLDDGSKIDLWEGLSSPGPVSYRHLVGRILERVSLALARRGCASGTLPVLLTPKAASRIIGIVTAGFNAKALWKGVSPFADKRDTVFFNEKLSIHDDPGMQGSPYSYPFDDEGVTASRKALVDRGRIAHFITDLKHAHKLNITPTGNGSRGYASLPSPSSSNIEIEGGSTASPDIIRSIDRGILVDQFIGLGQSNTATGDFSANLDLAYLIEKGEVAGRVKDCMITGNLFTLLQGDIAVSVDRERQGSVLAPYLLLPGVSYTGSAG